MKNQPEKPITDSSLSLFKYLMMRSIHETIYPKELSLLEELIVNFNKGLNIINRNNYETERNKT